MYHSYIMKEYACSFSTLTLARMTRRKQVDWDIRIRQCYKL